MLFIAFAVYLAAISEQAHGMLPLLPERTSLVRGVVVSAKEMRAHLVSEVRVEHVYHGAADAVGRTFSVNSMDPDDEVRPTSMMYVFKPRLRLGDRGIWLVVAVRDSSHDMVTEDRYNYMAWPVLETGGPAWAPPFQAITAFAETVQRVSKLPGQHETVAALKRLAADRNPYISSWAIARLPVVSQRSAEVFKFLKDLVADSGIPIQGQVELDRVLLGQDDGSISVEHHDPRWQLSEARVKLYRRWFAAAQSGRDAQLVVTRLDITAQHPGEMGFRQEELMQLVTLLLNNDKLSLAERQRASTIIMWAASRYETDVGIFKSAIALVSSDLPEQLRTAVAAEFVRGFTLDETRRESLQKLRDAETAKSVVALLDKALARPNGKPKREFVAPGAPRHLKRREPFSALNDNDPLK